MINKNLKYFCEKCKSVKLAKIVIVHVQNENSSGETRSQEIEVIKSFSQNVLNPATGKKEAKGEIKTRQLECGHFIRFHTPAFLDPSSDNLSELEAKILRSEIDKTMIGKNAKELEEIILFHCEEYQVLLKISAKQQKQAKYAIQYLDQLREKYSKLLSNEEEKQKFETKFYHFLDLKPSTPKTLERERKEVVSTADKQKAAIAEMKALLMKKGGDFKLEELFKKPFPSQSLNSSELKGE